MRLVPINAPRAVPPVLRYRDDDNIVALFAPTPRAGSESATPIESELRIETTIRMIGTICRNVAAERFRVRPARASH